MRKRRERGMRKGFETSKSGDMNAFNYFFGKKTTTKDECKTPLHPGLKGHLPISADPVREFAMTTVRKQDDGLSTISNTY